MADKSAYKFLHTASCMAVAMAQICHLSRIFQKQNLDYSVINEHIEGCILPWKLYFISLDQISLNFTSGTYFEMNGHRIRDSVKDRMEAHNCSESFIETVVLKSKFLETSDQTVLKALSKLFNPVLYPTSVDPLDEGYNSFGLEEIALVSNHFETLKEFNKSAAQQEFPHFKSFVVKYICAKMQNLWLRFLSKDTVSNFPS